MKNNVCQVVLPLFDKQFFFVFKSKTGLNTVVLYYWLHTRQE